MGTRRYQIIVSGRLGLIGREAFREFQIDPHGADTALTGDLDRSGLHDVLTRLRDLALDLVGVTCLSPEPRISYQIDAVRRQGTQCRQAGERLVPPQPVTSALPGVVHAECAARQHDRNAAATPGDTGLHGVRKQQATGQLPRQTGNEQKMPVAVPGRTGRTRGPGPDQAFNRLVNLADSHTASGAVNDAGSASMTH